MTTCQQIFSQAWSLSAIKEFDKEDKDNFDTLNGFMVSRLGHIPKAGEKGSVRIGDYLLKIMKVENKVIQTVLAIPLPKEEKK